MPRRLLPSTLIADLCCCCFSSYLAAERRIFSKAKASRLPSLHSRAWPQNKIVYLVRWFLNVLLGVYKPVCVPNLIFPPSKYMQQAHTHALHAYIGSGLHGDVSLPQPHMWCANTVVVDIFPTHASLYLAMHASSPTCHTFGRRVGEAACMMTHSPNDHQKTYDPKTNSTVPCMYVDRQSILMPWFLYERFHVRKSSLARGATLPTRRTFDSFSAVVFFQEQMYLRSYIASCSYSRLIDLIRRGDMRTGRCWKLEHWQRRTWQKNHPLI